jgi:hypothetical protein
VSILKLTISLIISDENIIFFALIFLIILAFGKYEQLVFFPLKKNIRNIKPIENPPK